MQDHNRTRSNESSTTPDWGIAEIKETKARNTQPIMRINQAGPRVLYDSCPTLPCNVLLFLVWLCPPPLLRLAHLCENHTNKGYIIKKQQDVFLFVKFAVRPRGLLFRTITATSELKCSEACPTNTTFAREIRVLKCLNFSNQEFARGSPA